MVKWWQRISFKLFLAIFSLLVVILGVIFGSIYLFLPDYQYEQELKRNYGLLEGFVEELNNKDSEEVQQRLVRFYGETNVKFIVISDEGQLFFPFAYFDRLPDASVLNDIGIGSIHSRADNYANTRHLMINGKGYSITYSIPVTSKEQISQVLLAFLLYAFVISSALAGIGAWFLAKRITEPVLRINETANKMEQLDFSAVLPKNRKDELGQLSDNLNSMSKSVELNLVELNSANAQLQIDAEILKFEEQKRKELAAVISHELKTPIAAVMGQLEAMSLNVGPYADRDYYLKESYKIMSDMEKLAEDILEIAKVDYVNLQDNLQRIDLSKAIMTIVNRQHQFFSTGLMTKVEVPEGVFIDTQEILFSKALENIVSNAYQYCLENGQVSVVLKVLEDAVELVVTNSAISIAESDLKRIFEAFYRVDESRNSQSGGTGLGLYIVANNFEKLNIGYRMSSKNNLVSFTMLIPKTKEETPI